MNDPDVSKCPLCGGDADNGHDRTYPPNPYHCTKCEQGESTPESILEEAARLTSGPRNDYGPPKEDYTRTAALWTALLAHKLKDDEAIEWDDAIRCMCAVKLSRDVHKRGRDNMVDLAGYAHCRQLAEES